MSAPKTVGVIFTQKRSVPELDIKIDNRNVQFKKEAKFLGLIFDHKLSWKKHVDYIHDRCKKRINLLRCISGYSWGVDGPLLLRLYKALIRPVIDYGCEAYDSTTNTVKKSLDSIQYKVLKICTGAIRGTSLKSLQVECGEPPLKVRRNFLTNSYGAVIQANSQHPNRNMFIDNWQKQYFFNNEDNKFHKPFEARVKKFNHNLMDNGYPPVPFWDFKEVDTSIRIQTLINKVVDDRVKKEIVTREINSFWGTALHIYTDGSLEPKSQRVGCSLIVPFFKYSRGFRLTTGLSIFSAELIAIYMALEWIDDVKPRDVVIFSDCKSAVTSLAKFDHDNKIIFDIQRLYMSLHSQGIKVEIVWIPGHVGICGNDWADKKKKKAVEKEKVDISVKLNKSECKSILKSQLKEEWQADWLVYNNTNMMKKIRPDIKLYMPNWTVKREWEILFHRLRLGKCRLLNFYLYSIGKHPNGNCDVCYVQDTVEHFILECKKYDTQRRILKKELEKEGIKKFNIANILGGKIPPIAEVMSYVKKCKKTL